MASNCTEGLGDDFLEQMLAVPSVYSSNISEGAPGAGYGRSVGTMPTGLQFGSTSGDGLRESIRVGMPLGLNLEPGFPRHQQSSVSNDYDQLRPNNNNYHRNSTNNSTMSSSSSTSGITERDSMHMKGLYAALGQLHNHAHVQSPVLSPASSLFPPHLRQPLHGQPQTPVSVAAVPQAGGIRPRVRARRGQATDPHSIAERLRRERISERMKALQELVPSANKTDRAAVLDEIVDYVKFLRLQVKVLSMSRLGGAGAVAQLVADVPLSALEGKDIVGGANQQAWDKWSNDGTEQEVAKLMEEDVGAAMQFLQSKALCIMPISLASTTFGTPQSEAPSLIMPESNS